MFGQRRGDGRGGEVEKTSLQVASDLVVGRRVGKVHFEFMFVCSDGFVCDIMVPHMFSGTVFARHPASFFCCWSAVEIRSGTWALFPMREFSVEPPEKSPSDKLFPLCRLPRRVAS